MSNPTVYLERCHDYTQVADVLPGIWEKMGGPELVRGKKVLLKANLTKGGPPEWAVATDPRFVRIAAELVRDAGGEPYIGDSASIYGFTRETMDLAGYTEMAKEIDVPLIPLDSGKIERVTINGVRVKELYFSEHVLNADVIISVPKFKTHDFVGITNAIKNLYGTVPGAIKPYLHWRHPAYLNFLNVILDVVQFVKPTMALIDAVLCMEGQGPTTGAPKHVGLVAGGTDLVAIDSVFCEIAGWPCYEILKIAQQRGMGVCDLDKIDVAGPSIDDVRTPVMPAKASLAKSSFFGKIKYGVRHFSIWPDLNPAAADELKQMAELCPTDAIDLTGPTPRVLPTCVKCMSCIESSHTRAATLKVLKILHGTYRSKAPGYKLDHMH